MIFCGKCNKRPEKLEQKLCVLNHKYDVTASCHGQRETRSFSITELSQSETEELSVFFFASDAVPSKKQRSKVSSGTLHREGRVRGLKDSEL